MAYIPGYTFDIFISYAHLDNLKMIGQEHGWIELFYQSLKLKLDQRVGKMDAVKIWWDSKKLDGSKLFDNSIEDGIRNSAIFISLLSPGYLNSAYCKQEMDLFYSKSAAEKAGASVGDSARMIKVLLNNIPYTQLPAEFGRATGFPFFKAEDKDDFGEPLDYTDPVFGQQLKDLRDALVHIFEMFPKDQSAEIVKPVGAALGSPVATTVAPDSGANADGLTIFFGEVSDSLRTTRKRTINELEKNGFNIITDIPPPDEAAAHEQKVTEVLKQSDIAVHLLDQYPGRDIRGGDSWYTKKQVELSLQLSPAKLIWMPADMNDSSVEEESYRSFLSTIEKSNDPDNKFEFIKGSKSELTAQIIDYAVSVKQSKIRKDSAEKIAILLDTHFSDQQYAFELGKAMLENNIESIITPQEDDPRKNINLLADRISQVNKLVFLYGHVSKEWVLARMSAALQLIVTNNYPIDDFYVYLAPPNKASADIQLNQRFLKVNVLNNSAQPELTAALLNDFIIDMKGGALHD